MGAPGSELILVRKVGGSPATSIAIAAADSTNLTAGGGGQRVAIVALNWFGPTAAGATGLITIGDAATTVMTLLIPSASLQFYQDFVLPIPITSGTNDMRVTATFASQNAAVLSIWYKTLI